MKFAYKLFKMNRNSFEVSLFVASFSAQYLKAINFVKMWIMQYFKAF